MYLHFSVSLPVIILIFTLVSFFPLSFYLLITLCLLTINFFNILFASIDELRLHCFYPVIEYSQSSMSTLVANRIVKSI